MLKQLLERVRAFFRGTVDFTTEVISSVPKTFGATYLLGAQLVTLRELTENAVPLGMVYFRITPIQLTTEPQKIIDREVEGRLRRVSIAIDSAVGGPTPTIRFGNSGLSANNGGVRLNAGVINELGEVAPNAELWAAASTTISAYIIERA